MSSSCPPCFPTSDNSEERYAPFHSVFHPFSEYSAYGIGTYKRVKNEFEPVADPMYDIVLKKVFERICEILAPLLA